MIILDPSRLLEHAEEALTLACSAEERGFPDIARNLKDVALRYQHMAEQLLRRQSRSRAMETGS